MSWAASDKECNSGQPNSSILKFLVPDVDQMVRKTMELKEQPFLPITP